MKWLYLFLWPVGPWIFGILAWLLFWRIMVILDDPFLNAVFVWVCIVLNLAFICDMIATTVERRRKKKLLDDLEKAGYSE